MRLNSSHCWKLGFSSGDNTFFRLPGEKLTNFSSSTQCRKKRNINEKAHWDLQQKEVLCFLVNSLEFGVMLHKTFVDIQIILWYLLFQFMSSFKELLGKYGFPQAFFHFLPIYADNTTRESNIFTTHLAFSNWELFTACSIWNIMEQASVYHCEALVLLATSGLAFTCTSAPEWMQFTPAWLNCHGSPEVRWKCNFCDASDIVSHLFLLCVQQELPSGSEK